MIKLSTVGLLALLILNSCSSSQKRELTKEERAQMLTEMAAADINEGDSTSALVYLKQAEEITPKSADVHYLLALTYYKKNEIGMASRSAQKAIQLSPHYSAAKNTLGKLLLDQGKLNEAEKYLKEAAQDLTYREAYLAKTNLGYLYYKKLKHTDAEYWYSKAIFEAGDNACMAYFYRGQLNFEKNLFEKANADFNRASRKNCAQFSDAHLAMGKTFLRMKKYDQARAKLIEVQQLFPTSDAAMKANDYLREIP